MQPPPALWIPILDLISRSSSDKLREKRRAKSRLRDKFIGLSLSLFFFFKGYIRKNGKTELTRDDIYILATFAKLYLTWYNFVIRKLQFSEISELKEQQIEKKIVEFDKFAIYPYFLYGEMGQVLGRHLQRLTFQSKIVYRRVYRSTVP